MPIDIDRLQQRFEGHPLFANGARDLPFTDRAIDLPQARDVRSPHMGRFDNAFRYAVEQVDGFQKEADAQIETFIAGEQENLHEVMIAMNQARTTFQLLVEVRNKALDGYLELMRMQV